MTKVLRRLFLGALLLLIASGALSGVFVASGESPSQGAQVISVGALTQVSLGEVQTFSFTPSANAQYGVYLFPENEGAAARAEIRLDGETIAEGEGALCLFTCRLNAGTTYELVLSGSGAARVEIARETLSRSWSMPLEIADGDSYSKMIARAGDVHWYAIDAARSGAAILAAAPEDAIAPQLWLFDANGRLLAESEALASGSGVLSAQFTSGERYYVRVAAGPDETGSYLLSCLRSAVTDLPESVRLSASELTLEGRSSASLIAETLPAGVCPLVFLDSSDPTVAAVLPDGTLQGRQSGAATVTAYAYGGARATCTVTVTEVAVEGIALAFDSLAMEVGDTASLSPQLIPENATNRGLTFITEDESVVTVDRRGRITAVGEGSARVVAVTADGGMTDVVFVTVDPAPRRYRALLIGEQNYASTVDELRPGSIRSVNSIKSLLETASFDGESFSISTLLDAPRDDVVAAIRSAFADAAETDLSLVYITCHGFYRAGMTFFVMSDGSVLSASDLERELRAIPGEIVLLIDCCGSGGLIGEAGSSDDLLDGITSVFQGTVGPASVRGSKYRVVASALLDQDSYRISFSDDGDEGMATVFARALCDAAGWSIDRGVQSAMNADANYDGQITLDELGAYMERRVSWYLNLAGSYAQNVRVYPEGDDSVLFARTGE